VHLAKEARLELSASPDTLAEAATELRSVLCFYVLDLRSYQMWKRPASEVISWTTGLAAIMRECVAALGGNPAASLPLDSATTSPSDAAQLLQSGLLVAKGRGQAAVIHGLLQPAAGYPTEGPVDARMLESAIERLVNYLAALSLVANAATDSWRAYQQHFGQRVGAGTKGGVPPTPRWQLFYCLASIFERLHGGRKFAVSKSAGGGVGMRATKTTGSAVVWTRGLLALAIDAEHSAGCALLPELIVLHDWAVEKPEGFGEHIDEAGRGLRKSQVNPNAAKNRAH
jgi:hypothetical protein